MSGQRPCSSSSLLNSGMETGHMTTAVFIDFRKAFDKVWHHGLLYKLTTAGVSLSSVSWLSDYLSSRTIAVRVGTNTISPRQPISAGVPQGSHFGPTIFLVFINDLPTSVPVSTELYADDALIHQQTRKIQQQKSAISYNTNDSIDRHAVEFQDSITAADLWAQSWHGKFGPEKTKALQAGRLLHCDATPRLSIGNQVISHVTVHKHLGVLLRQDLKWSNHIHEVARCFTTVGRCFTSVARCFTSIARCFTTVARCFTTIARCFTTVARYFTGVGRCFASVGRCFTSVCRCFTSVARYFTIVARYFTIVARCFTSVARCFTGVASCFTSVGRCFTAIARCFTTVGRCFTTVGCCFTFVDRFFPAAGHCFPAAVCCFTGVAKLLAVSRVLVAVSRALVTIFPASGVLLAVSRPLLAV